MDYPTLEQDDFNEIQTLHFDGHPNLLTYRAVDKYLSLATLVCNRREIIEHP
jgi:hypothetical protein